MPSYVVGLAGLSIGTILGYAIRRAKLCTFAAIEDATVGGDTRRLKVFALALAIAIIGTQALIAFGLIDPQATPYVPAAFPWLAAAVGGFLFGVGMALVGTCAFGSLVRLGGGDLRSLVVLMVFGLVAYATIRGVIAAVRVDYLDRAALALPGVAQGDLPSVVGTVLPFDSRLVLAAAASGGLIVWSLTDRRLWCARRLIWAGAVLGISVLAGWVATGVLPDPLNGDVRPQSLNFVAPVGRAIYGALLGQIGMADFGVGAVFGVALGSGAAAARSHEFRWEAFDDQREMRRHLVGAVLMGFGGVCAGGCTIGQGMTAASLLAVAAPIAAAGMIVGARVGIFFLVEGSTGKALLNALRTTRQADR
ncbi:MAG: YeeE/YedE family protein [Rhodospirillales bacterium]